MIARLAHWTRSRPHLLRGSDRLAGLGVDSLTKVELVAEIESQFGLLVDDETAGALGSVQDLFDLVASAGGAATVFGAAGPISSGSREPSAFPPPQG